MPEKLQGFVINIAVIEGRHYVWPNMNSTVQIKIDNFKKSTAVKFNTDSPFYNEFMTTLERLLDKSVTITVVKPGSILSKSKILGSTTFDVGMIWYQKDHHLYHKWAILSSPTKDTSGTRGYLKLDVSVLCKGESPKIPPLVDTDDIEKNLFLPNGITNERQKSNFIFDIYRGKDIVKKSTLLENSKKNDNLPSTQLEVSFSGTQVKTSVKKNSSTPVWNERLTITELFPPLCQRFKFDLLIDGNKKATRYLNLHTISSDKEEGFLPTFGPSFLHFYSSNHLEGYLGKILLSLQTVLLGDLADYESKVYITESQVQPLREDYFLKYENVVLFAAIFDVSSIIKKFSDKNISFRLACGPIQEENEDRSSTAVTTSIKPKMFSKNYSFLQIDEDKPCVSLNLNLPDIRQRMYNYNLLIKILSELKIKLVKIEEIFSTEDYKAANADCESLIFETLDFISTSTEKYIDLASNYSSDNYSLLDKERLKLCLKEMGCVKACLCTISKNQSKTKIFRKFEKLYTKIESLIDIVEDWPKVYFWLIYGNKRVAYSIIQPRDIIHSVIDEEKGVNCGKIQTLHFQNEDSQNFDFLSSVCKMEVMMWMGLSRHLKESIPSGFKCSESIPRSLTAEQSHLFQAKVYIFQGRFSPGSDRNSLCDPFVQVIIKSHSRQTQVLRKNLTPIWNETLVFNNLILYGSEDFIRKNPPQVYFEVYDKDEWFKAESVGKCVVTPVLTMLNQNYTPTKLFWLKLYNNFDVNAEVLAAAEFIEVSTKIDEIDKEIVSIPQEIKPHLINHRIEVVFWGVRNLRKVQLSTINKPKIVVDCGDSSLASDLLPNSRKNLNFPNPVKSFEMQFPTEESYAPPLTLRMIDSRNFGINVFCGVHVTNVSKFLYQPLTASERETIINTMPKKSLELTPITLYVKKSKKSKSENDLNQKTKTKKKWHSIFIKFWHKPKVVEAVSSALTEVESEDDSDFDWWTKFYASLEENSNDFLSRRYKLKIYNSELEKQPEFSGFTDTLHSFPMYKGKRTGDESVDEENTTGIFKGTIRVYKWPLSDDYVSIRGTSLKKGIFQDFASNSSLKYILRVYCVRGINLTPKDLNRKSDPFIRLTLNQQVINDKENRIMGQLNPIFGRCYELNGMFPQDHTLVISLIDYDSITNDDLIGETKIDLENRFYTKHRAHCGLAQNYLTEGYCQWRDLKKPTTILEGLCSKNNLQLQYENKFVRIASREFKPANFNSSGNTDFDRQVLALEALNHWYEIPLVGCVLVPEHVETRSLYNPQMPGIEQGKLQLWIDILPRLDVPPPKQVNITPRKPVPYELRVIIWNAQNIKLDESDWWTGEKKCDVFFKGWVSSPDESQYTDVHYRSLNGEANFNWRFIFTFDYLSSENKIVIKKQAIFHSEEEEKIPCRLFLQIWDDDTFSYDEFLGALTLELSKLPRGSRTFQNCSLDQLKYDAKFLNLFKTRRTKGWWPLKNLDSKNRKEILVGCVELEFELLTKEDAEKCPAGFGRDDPQGLPKPNRPETSFSLFKNPFQAFKYSMKVLKKKLIKVLIFLIVCIIIFVAIYHVPGLIAKKL